MVIELLIFHWPRNHYAMIQILILWVIDYSNSDISYHFILNPHALTLRIDFQYLRNRHQTLRAFPQIYLATGWCDRLVFVECWRYHGNHIWPVRFLKIRTFPVFTKSDWVGLRIMYQLISVTRQFLQHPWCRSLHWASFFRIQLWGSQQGSSAMHICGDNRM